MTVLFKHRHTIQHSLPRLYHLLDSGVYSREIMNIVFVGQVSGLVENFNIGIDTDTIFICDKFLTKKSAREPACPAQSPSCFRCSCAGLPRHKDGRCMHAETSLLQGAPMPKVVFFSELQEGMHNCGAPRKHYRDKLKRQLPQVGISHRRRRPQTERVGAHK